MFFWYSVVNHRFIFRKEDRKITIFFYKQESTSVVKMYFEDIYFDLQSTLEEQTVVLEVVVN